MSTFGSNDRRQKQRNTKNTDSTLDALLKQIHQATNLENALEDLCEERQQLRKANTDNLITIAALQAGMDTLEQDNANMVAFIDALDKAIAIHLKTGRQRSTGSIAVRYIQRTVAELKAEHIDNTEVTE